MSARFAASAPGRDRRVRAEPGASATPTKPLGAVAVDTARAAIADAGLDVAQIDGFTTGSIFPTAGAHTIEDGVSIVTANWMAEHLGVNPRCGARLPGLRPDPRARSSWR